MSHILRLEEEDLTSSNLSDTTPSMETLSSTTTSLRGSPSLRVSQLAEEESTSLNSSVMDSPPLPPKGPKLSASSLVDGQKTKGPPAIPRRSSAPYTGDLLGRTSKQTGNDRRSVVHASQELPVASHQLQKQSPGNSTSDSPRKLKPIPLRRPVSQLKHGTRDLPEIPKHPTTAAKPSTSWLASVVETQVLSVVSPSDAKKPTDGISNPTDRTSPEAEAKPTSTAPDSGDSNSMEVATPRRTVCEISRDFDARTSTANFMPSDSDRKSSVPGGRRLDIPLAFQKLTS